jgi:DNA-directed RNA polymerase subunit beta'
MINDEYNIPGDWKVAVLDGDQVSQGDLLAYLGETATITAQNPGRVRIETEEAGNGSTGGAKVFVSYESRQEATYEIPSTARVMVKDGDHVEPGQPLTEGSLNPHRILRIQGRNACQIYLLSEVQKVYRSQGQNIHDKHFEVVIRKMISKVQVTRPGDTNFLPGDLVDYIELKRANDQLLADGKRPARFIEVLLGITKASLSTDSFLSASSFQHTIKVLAGAAIAASEDPLFGLKENVIIGKLIPAGTGFVRGRFADEKLLDRQEANMYSDSPYDGESLGDFEFGLTD